MTHVRDTSCALMKLMFNSQRASILSEELYDLKGGRLQEIRTF